MKKYIGVFITLLLVVGLSGCGEEESKVSPVKIETVIHDQYLGTLLFKIPQVTITAIADVAIQDVILNEGNGCRLSSSQPKLPSAMKYGDRVVRTYTAQCNVMKVEVVTDKGNWSVEY